MTPLLILYFLASGFTWVSGEAGVGITGRVAVADVIMLVFMLLVLLLTPGALRRGPLVLAGCVMMVAFSLGILNSATLTQSLVEWLVHLFSLASFVVLYGFIASKPMDQRLSLALWWVRCAAALAALGIYEFLCPVIGLPSLLTPLGFRPRTFAAVVGTFRNTGQAGIFYVFGFAGAVALARALSGRPRMEATLAAVVLALATLLTVKRSALLALVAGIALLLLFDSGGRTRLRNVMVIGLMLVVCVPALQWTLSRSAAFESRVDRKLGDEDVTERVGSFARENVRAAVSAFSDHPVVGAGLGGVAGVYTERFEIHSTYLSVPATTGLVGSLAYLYFMYTMFRTCTRRRNDDERARIYGRAMLPLLIGLTFAFGYTYHLRKREFWVTVALAAAIMAPAVAARAPETRRPLAPAAGPGWARRVPTPR